MTVTHEPDVDPEICPSPVMVQAWTTVPPAGVTVEQCVLVVPPHTADGPSIVHCGFGLTVTLAPQLTGFISVLSNVMVLVTE